MPFSLVKRTENFSGGKPVKAYRDTDLNWCERDKK